MLIPSKWGEFSPNERGNPAICYESGSRQAEFKTPGYFSFVLRGRQQRLRFDGVFCLRTIVVLQGNLASVFPLLSQIVTSFYLHVDSVSVRISKKSL